METYEIMSACLQWKGHLIPYGGSFLITVTYASSLLFGLWSLVFGLCYLGFFSGGCSLPFVVCVCSDYIIFTWCYWYLHQRVFALLRCFSRGDFAVTMSNDISIYANWGTKLAIRAIIGFLPFALSSLKSVPVRSLIDNMLVLCGVGRGFDSEAGWYLYT